MKKKMISCLGVFMFLCLSLSSEGALASDVDEEVYGNIEELEEFDTEWLDVEEIDLYDEILTDLIEEDDDELVIDNYVYDDDDSWMYILYATTVDDTDIRIEPDGMSPIRITIPPETTLILWELQDEWAMVEYEGETGYVLQDNLIGEDLEWLKEELRWLNPDGEDSDQGEILKTPTVDIFTSRRESMELGETVKLTSRISNGEGYEFRYQWQWDRGDGFEDIEGANEDTYCYAASVQTFSYGWRLILSYRRIE